MNSFNPNDYRIYIDRPVNIDGITVDIYQYAEGKTWHASLATGGELEWTPQAPYTVRERPTFMLQYPLSQVFMEALQRQKDESVEKVLREQLDRESKRVDDLLRAAVARVAS